MILTCIKRVMDPLMIGFRLIPNLVVLINLNVKSPYAKSLFIGESNVIEKVVRCNGSTS